MIVKIIFKNKINIIFIIIWFLFITYSLININYLAVPTSDIFQYINEGNYYSKFKLPPTIHPAPLVPFLISTLTIFTKLFSQYPEITSAHLINIFSSSLLILFVYLIIKKYSNKIALITTILLSTNMFFIASTLNVTNEVLYGLELSIIIYLYQKKRFSLVYLLSSIAFLTRYEAIVIPIAIITTELILNKNKIKIKYLLLYIIPVLLWVYVLTKTSQGSIFNSPYLLDIKNSGKELININPLTDFSKSILVGPIYYFVNPSLKPIIKIFSTILIFFIIIKSFLNKKTPHIFKISYSILFFQIFSLMFFPYYFPRYLFATFWIIYLSILSINNKIIIYFFILIFGITNIYNFGKPSGFLDPTHQIEYRHIANWVNKETFDKNSLILIFEPWVLDYYIKNPNIKVYWNDSNIINNCNNDIICVAQNLSKEYSHIYIIKTSYSSSDFSNLQDQDSLNKHKILIFQDNMDFNENLKLITILSEDNKWSKIYQYIPQKK